MNFLQRCAESLIELENNKEVKNKVSDHICGYCSHYSWNLISRSSYNYSSSRGFCCLYSIGVIYDYTCYSWFDANNSENINKISKEKEVKKVNKIPYFETKVVKVKKQPKDSATIYNQCPICKEIHKCNFKKQSNFVNGENIEKIKFPCLCSFLIFDKKIYGELDYVGHNRELLYLKDLVGQNYDERYYTQFPICNLDKIIREKKIHILKGKIIIFEEEK